MIPQEIGSSEAVSGVASCCGSPGGLLQIAAIVLLSLWLSGQQGKSGLWRHQNSSGQLQVLWLCC